MTDEQLERAAVDMDSFTTEERRALRDRTDLDAQIARAYDEQNAEERYSAIHDSWVGPH